MIVVFGRNWIWSLTIQFLKVLAGMVFGISVMADPIFDASYSPVVGRIKSGSTIGEILEHPSFMGFADRLLPRVQDRNKTELSLRQMDVLMPYHSWLNAVDMAGGLNFLIQQSEQSTPLFIELYSATEIEQDPRKGETGLFFLKGKATAPFAIIAPGGGFAYVATLHEGLPLARVLAEHGLNAFVLRYRTGLGQRAATEDLARAISIVFEKHRALGVNTSGYSLWGASAGARMTALIGSYGPARFGGAVTSRPSSVVMPYTGHLDTAEHEPATFVAVGELDGISSPRVMQQRVQALEMAGTPVEFHRYANTGHGFGLGTGSSAEGWIDDAIRFWRANRHE